MLKKTWLGTFYPTKFSDLKIGFKLVASYFDGSSTEWIITNLDKKKQLVEITSISNPEMKENIKRHFKFSVKEWKNEKLEIYPSSIKL